MWVQRGVSGGGGRTKETLRQLLSISVELLSNLHTLPQNLFTHLESFLTGSRSGITCHQRGDKVSSLCPAWHELPTATGRNECLLLPVCNDTLLVMYTTITQRNHQSFLSLQTQYQTHIKRRFLIATEEAKEK